VSKVDDYLLHVCIMQKVSSYQEKLQGIAGHCFLLHLWNL